MPVQSMTMETMVYGVEYGPSVVQLSEQVSLLSSLVAWS
jgi:hypothetical protein